MAVDKAAVLAKLLALKGMTLEQLRALWLELYKSEPRKTSNKQHLAKHLAYRIQVLAYGGDSAETEARLAAHAKEYFGNGKKVKRSKSIINLPFAGTVLCREYHGVEHQVAVLQDKAFQYNGCKYKSLSSIAKHITGMSWSGPEFFRLKQRAGRGQ